MSSSVAVNLIRQWCYCPRVVYYMEMTDLAIQRPIWVEQGEHFHRLEERLWRRRNLQRFALEEGERHHNVALSCSQLGLHGIVDMAIETDENVYAIEFKLSASNRRRGDLLQLTAYAMLLERHFGKASPVGFLVGKGKVLHKVEIDAARRSEVGSIAALIQKMLERSVKPETSASVVQCCNCEYLNFCNDRL